jgi:CRISPR-associated protein Cmr6
MQHDRRVEIVGLPADYLAALPERTRTHVLAFYEAGIEYDARDVESGRTLSIGPPDGTGVNPGLFLSKYCLDPGLTKDAKRLLFLRAWAKAAQGSVYPCAEALLERRVEQIAAISMHARSIPNATVEWRMVIGLGNPSPLETGFSLHPQYGIPWLNGSSVKGLTQAGRLRRIGEEIGVYPLPYDQWLKGRKSDPPVPSPLELLERILLRDGEDDEIASLFELLKSRPEVGEAIAQAMPKLPLTEMPLVELTERYGAEYRGVFGSPGRRGGVTFIDAIPIPGWKYKVDVMTPHFGDYYGDTKNQTPPADWLKPTPVTFLTLDKGSQFRFDLLGKEKQFVDCACKWLKEAVSLIGIGGKTNAGYGELTIREA